MILDIVLIILIPLVILNFNYNINNKSTGKEYAKGTRNNDFQTILNMSWEYKGYD